MIRIILKFIKGFLYKMEQNKKKKEVIKFLNNVATNSPLFKYKLNDSYFHIYIKNKTYNLELFLVPELDRVIENVCHYLHDNGLRIKKEFFKGL